MSFGFHDRLSEILAGWRKGHMAWPALVAMGVELTVSSGLVGDGGSVGYRFDASINGDKASAILPYAAVDLGAKDEPLHSFLRTADAFLWSLPHRFRASYGRPSEPWPDCLPPLLGPSHNLDDAYDGEGLPPMFCTTETTTP